MKQLRNLILFQLLVFPLFMQAQNNDTVDCYPIKFLDFYGVSDSTNVAIWSNNQILQLIQEPTPPPFFIPVVVSQLPNYYSNCNSKVDTIALDNLTHLYALISKTELDSLLKPNKGFQIDLMRNIFYDRIDNDSLVAEMMFTTDDGPFFGDDIPYSEILVDPDYTLHLAIGILAVHKQPNRVIVEFRGKDDEISWRKELTLFGVEEDFSELHIPEDVYQTTSFSTKISLYLDEEELSLYLRNNGEFMFYFYSW